MPQKQKSKTKKEMKKSINNIWSSLQKEKGRHAKATGYIALCKRALCQQKSIMQAYRSEVKLLRSQLEHARNDKAVTSRAMAELIRNLE